MTYVSTSSLASSSHDHIVMLLRENKAGTGNNTTNTLSKQVYYYCNMKVAPPSAPFLDDTLKGENTTELMKLTWLYH